MLGFAEEKKMFKSGYKKIAGIDEAGRGSLAGPVVAACVACLSLWAPADNKLKEVDDSKKLSTKKREELFGALVKCQYLKIGVGIVDREEIDRINILRATLQAMKKALAASGAKPEFIFIDGKNKIPKLKTVQRAVTNGDEKIFLIAAASIIAKVTRDRLMAKYHQRYPVYCFNKNKGYGTKAHFMYLRRYGACFLHRQSFEPIKTMLKKERG